MTKKCYFEKTNNAYLVSCSLKIDSKLETDQSCGNQVLNQMTFLTSHVVVRGSVLPYNINLLSIQNMSHASEELTTGFNYFGKDLIFILVGIKFQLWPFSICPWALPFIPCCSIDTFLIKTPFFSDGYMLFIKLKYFGFHSFTQFSKCIVTDLIESTNLAYWRRCFLVHICP